MANCKICGKHEFVMQCVCDDCTKEIAAPSYRRWISVKDRLPTEGERFDDEYNELIPLLVCTSGTKYPFRAFYDGKKWGDGWGEVVVTHWMPLPELPKEEITWR